jgi:nitric oxide reductase activation protein
MPNFDHTKIKRLLKAYPKEVSETYIYSRRILKNKLPEEILINWENVGLSLAQENTHSWECALAFFKVSVEVQQHLPSGQFIGWCDSGLKLTRKSTKISISFFDSSPKTMTRLRPRYIEDWVSRVENLYKGTWKSTILTCNVFESSPTILETISFDQYCKLIEFIESLSNRSYDIASEILETSTKIFSINFQEIDDLLQLSISITEKEWRDVKPTYEIILNQIVKLPNANIKLIFEMSKRLFGLSGINISNFFSMIMKTLTLVNKDDRDEMLHITQHVVNNAPYVTMDFLKSVPTLLETLDLNQLDQWKNNGIRLALDQDTNPIPPTQFFKLESKMSKDLIDQISSSVELTRIKELMKLYCTGLSGEDVSVANSSNLSEKNIGWTQSDLPTSDGKTIYLPNVISKYPMKDENFDYFKVIATHQQALLEFGTFKYDPKIKPRNKKSLKIHEILKKALDELDESNESKEEHATRFAKVLRAIPPFNSDPQLASDLFGIVENYRVDQRVLLTYQGLKKHYKYVQQEQVDERKDSSELNEREAIIEEIIKFTLGKRKNFKIRRGFTKEFKAIIGYFLTLKRIDGNVEDSMAVAVRIFDRIARLQNNESVPDEEIENIDIDESEDDNSSDEYEDEQKINEMMNFFGTPEASENGEYDGDEISPSDELEEEYNSPEPVEYQGDFKPELGQLLTEMLTVEGDDMLGEGEEMQGLTQEQIEELVKNSPDLETKEADENSELDSDANQELLENLMKEIKNRDLDNSSFSGGEPLHFDEDGGPLEATAPDTFTYDEWDFRDAEYKPNWCLLHEKKLADGETNFYKETLTNNSSLVYQIKKQFELVFPEMYRKQKRLEDGEEADLDAGIEALIDLRSNVTPDEKIYWRRNKTERSVAVALLIDMSASTAEAIDDGTTKSSNDDWGAPDDPVEYMVWLRSRRTEGLRRSYKRIVDVEKEGIVLMVNSLETLGDDYGVYGFSGYGRENVEFYTIKDLDEKFSDTVSGRIDRIAPLHATRMGPAIRHTISKLENHEAKSRFMFLITDGRPQDRGYSREGVEKEYAVYDTRQALLEAKQKGIVPFCLTVDKAGHDYLKTMMDDFSYEVLSDISMLPARLPELYKNLTS